MFRRMSSYYNPLRTASFLAAMLLAVASTNLVWGVGLTYVEGDPEFAANVTPLGAFASSAAVDNLWGKRTDFGAGVTVWESGATEDSPEIVQTVGGLTPGNSYDLYAVYWTDNDENWTMQAGLAPNTYTTYSWNGAIGTNAVVGSVPGAPAALAQWEPAGLPPAGPAGQGIQLYTERVTSPATATTFGTEDPLVMMLGKAGTAVADGGGNISVYMNDLPAPGGARRAWFDGVAYKPTDAAALTPTATLNRDTGQLTISNPTSVARDIKGIRIESVVTNASGALNGPAWTSVTSGNVNWSAVADPTAAVPAGTVPAATPFATNLVETGTTNITLAANGGTLNFGNVWNKSPFDNLAIHLILSDDTLAVLSPQVTGTAIALADLNFNGSIDTADYLALMTNIHTSIAGLTRVESLRKGDMTADGLVNFSDFAAFRAAYDLAHGSGSFAQMAAAVPEPGSLALCLIGGTFATCLSRRRRSISAAVVALGLCILMAGTARAVPLLAVDIDDRETVALGTEVGNTQAGFQSFTLKGTTASVPYTPEGDNTITSGTTTRVLGAYTVSVVAFDDHLDENNVTAGIQDTVGAIDDRDRTTPVDGGALTYAQIYDDFFFAGASVGPSGGADITISGGSLLPNKAYLFSVYSYDVSSAGTHSANYYDLTNTTAPILSTTWAGAAANNPTTNDQYKFSGLAVTDASGVLAVRGRASVGYPAAGGTTITGVFINGFEINEFTGLTLEVNTTTGAVRMLNEQGAPQSLSYYELRSTSGALNLAGWNSFDDQESGDPVGVGWDEAGGSTANILSEGNLESQLTLAASGNAILGNAFLTAGIHDLTFRYAEAADVQLRVGAVKYISTGVPGDYNGNGVVDGADYVLWRNGGPLQNEVDNPGTVNAADYAAWRSRFGNTAGSGSSVGGGAVPEPTSFALMTFVLSLAFGLRRSR